MTHPSSDALAAEERVVSVVATAINDAGYKFYNEAEPMFLDELAPRDREATYSIARAAIQAYQKAMREGSDG